MSRHLDPALTVSAHSLTETYGSHDGRHALPEPMGAPYSGRHRAAHGAGDTPPAQHGVSVLPTYGQPLPTPVRPVRGRTRFRRFMRQLIGETR